MGKAKTVLVSRGFLGLLVPESIRLKDAGPWLDAENPVWRGALPLGVFLSAEEQVSAEFTEFTAALNLSILTCNTDPQDALNRYIVDCLLFANDNLIHSAAQEREAAARLRQDYMQLQTGFVQVEHFLYGAMAPDFSLAREWAFTGDTTDQPEIEQPVPVGSTGLAAVDLWAMAAGDLTLHISRPFGPDLAGPITVAADAKGWCRFQLDTPLTGLAEDIVLRVTASQPLGLSRSSPIPGFQVNGDRPLAIRLWKGLPGVRLPDIPAQPGRSDSVELFPPSHMPAPEVIGGGSAEALENRDALSLHTDYNGDLHLVFRGLDWAGQANMSVYIQNHGPKVVNAAITATNGDEPLFLPATKLWPSNYVQIDVDLTGGAFDLHLRLTSETPMAHVILWGFERRPVV